MDGRMEGTTSQVHHKCTTAQTDIKIVKQIKLTSEKHYILLCKVASTFHLAHNQL